MRFSPRLKPCVSILLAAGGGLLLASAPARAQFTFTSITLDPGVSVYSFNDSLQVIGLDSNSHVFRTGPNAQGTTDLGTLDPAQNVNDPIAINNSGLVAGYGTTPDGSSHAFISSANGLVDIGTLADRQDPTNQYGLGPYNSYAGGINNHGQVVGASDALYHPNNFSPIRQHAFVYDVNTQVMTDLSGIPDASDPTGASFNTSANGINNAGLIVGVGDTNVGGGVFEQHAFAYDGTYHTLGTLNNTTQSTAVGVNNSGQIIGTSTYVFGNVSDVHAFLHTGTGLLAAGDDIGTFGGANSYAYYLNDLGQVVGLAEEADGITFSPFLYQNNTLTRISDYVPASANLNSLFIYGLNNSGQILGSGTDASGQTQYFLLAPSAAVPEPGALALLIGAGVSTAGLLTHKRRRHLLSAAETRP